ncbi:MAG: DUF885 family protein, partial [Alphaproteobacteria bacterium]|nr:DUF885 family protein [Alphaproteobacteria bacterium]
MLDRRSALKTGAAALALSAIPASAAPTGAAALNALFDQFMKENLDLSPVEVTSLGLDTGARAYQKGLVDDTSLAGIAKLKDVQTSQLKRLKTFARSSVSGMDQLNYDVVMYSLRTGDAAARRYNYGPAGAGQPYILSQLSGDAVNGPSFLDTQHTIQTKADAEAYVTRLGGLATALDQEIEVARHDMAQGVVAPDFALAKLLLLQTKLRAPSPENSPLTESVVRRTKDKKIAGDWQAQASKVIKDKLYPALDRQIAMVREMQKKATHDAGCWKLPNGEQYYRDSLVNWATTEMSPNEIHRIGMEIIKDHTARIDAIMKTHGMTKGSVGERLAAMYKDPSFLYPNTDAAKEKLIAELNEKVKVVRAKLSKLFVTLPKADVVIMRVPKNIEASQPGGYYNPPSLDGKRPGIYWINLRDTAEVPRWVLPTLTFHEAIPGHHMQISIANETKLPVIRKALGFSAYQEGWALYAEQVADEIGMYDNDPFGRIGQLHDSMFRGVRLVVDSGMHGLRWSREKALKFYVDALGNPESESITEIE